MVPWAASQPRIPSATSWFPKLFTKGREINILDDLTKKGSGALRSQNLVSLIKKSTFRSKKVFISSPLDFRQVSRILEVDSEPPWRRKILLVRSSRDEGEDSAPIGFYIREGFNVQVRSDQGSNALDKVPGVFVSRIVSGSLADTSGLISVGDELLDINNVPVAGKSLDEVMNMLCTKGVGVRLTLKPSPGRLFERGPRRHKQSLSAPTPRRNAGLHQPPRPQTPLLVTKRAEIRFESHELHEAEDLPPQILDLLRLADYQLIDH